MEVFIKDSLKIAPPAIGENVSPVDGIGQHIVENADGFRSIEQRTESGSKGCGSLPVARWRDLVTWAKESAKGAPRNIARRMEAEFSDRVGEVGRYVS